MQLRPFSVLVLSLVHDYHGNKNGGQVNYIIKLRFNDKTFMYSVNPQRTRPHSYSTGAPVEIKSYLKICYVA